MNTNYLLAVVITLLAFLHLSAQSTTVTVPLILPASDSVTTVVATVADGFLLYEGDIIIGKAQELPQKAATILSSGRLWPNGTMPYLIPEDHPADSTIREAIRHVNESTNLCLIERTDERDYVVFENGSSCASSIGKAGGRQTIVASQFCGYGAYIHEILHAAGVYHEHSRQDRDTYINVHFEHINDRYEGNFKKYYSGQDVGTYDYHSIMHYHAHAFTTTGDSTITLTNKAPAGTRIGQRAALSPGDIAGINNIYTEPSNCGTTNLSCNDSGDITDLIDVLQWDGLSVFNSGNQTTPATLVDLYFSRNSVITPNDVYLGSVEIPTIRSGEQYAFGESLDKESIDALANDRPYYLGFIIDAPDLIIESDENDNNDCVEHSDNILSGVLPVQLVDFSVQLTTNQHIQLDWRVSDQYQLAYYLVQSSEDGSNWHDGARVEATDQSTQSYQLVDSRTKNLAKQVVYYRLKMVDNDGSEQLSDIRTIRLDNNDNAGLTVFPNPSNGVFQIDLPTQLEGDYLIKITALNGQIVHQQVANSSALQIDLQQLAAGTYWMNIITTDEVLTQRIVLAR